MKSKYTYNICPEYDPDVFWKAVHLLDALLPSDIPRECIIDPLGDFLLMLYGKDENQIRCECDWDVGAVYVDSEINLDQIFSPGIP